MKNGMEFATCIFHKTKNMGNKWLVNGVASHGVMGNMPFDVGPVEIGALPSIVGMCRVHFLILSIVPGTINPACKESSRL